MRISTVNVFHKGLSRDLDGYARTPDSYYDALNALNASKEGDLFNITTEAGNINYTSITSTVRPGDKYMVIGKTIIGNDLVIFSVDTTDTYSEIGIISTSGAYTTVSNSTEYGFKIAHQIQAVGRIYFTGHRVVYWTDNYNHPRFLDLDNPFTSDINQQSSLIQDQSLAYITYLSTQEGGGNLPVGIVQYSVRYLNANLDPQAFGFVSQPVPVVDENRSVGRDLYDGGKVDSLTNKAINIQINNIDTNFKFLEIAAMYYSGATNDLKVLLLARKTITGATMQYTHTTMDNALDQLTLDDVSRSSTNYDTAKCIAQKDGILLLSNLTASTDAIDLQPMANAINVDYIINEIESKTESTYFGDYKDESLTFSMKGYLRGEVYSLGIGVVYKNGVKSLAYHIPADKFITTPATIVTPTTGHCGTWLSTIDYPIGLGYPVGKIRHHLMPTLQQQPHYSNVNGNNYIRILGLKLSNIIIPSNILDKVDSYFIVREQRTKSTNRSIISQGIAQTLFWTDNDYKFGDGNFSRPPAQVYKKTPLFGTTEIQQTDVSTLSGSRQTTFWTGLDSANIDREKIAFWSPEVVINQQGVDEGAYLAPVLSMKGAISSVDVRPGTQKADLLTIRLQKPFRAWLFCSYSNDPDTVDNSIVHPISLNTTKNFIAAAKTSSIQSDFNPAGSPGYALDNSLGTGFAYLSGQKNLPEPTYTADEISAINLKAVNPVDVVPGSGTINTEDVSDFAGKNSRRYLYNLNKDNPTQYGSIDQAEYILIKNSKEEINPYSTTVTCYNGDTFISKFAVYSKDNYRYRYFGYTFSTGDTHWDYAEQGGWDGYSETGMDLRALSEFFVESSINCNYRHVEFNGIENTPEYYPHASADAVLGIDPSIDNTNAYNKVYSIDNKIITYSSKAIGFIAVSSFPTRTIYSQQAIEGEQSDSYRIFAINNYHDLPRNTGEIWSTFVYNSGFYMRTVNSLWQGHLNENTAVSSNAGDLLVAQGGVFDRLSTEIFTLDGGYAGTQSQWADVTTPFGRFLLDVKQGKCFLFNGELNEISMEGMWNWFAENLKLTTFGDNPANPNGYGYHSVYDARYKRVLITKRDSNTSWTISFSFINKAWLSFHSYKPHFYIGNGQEFFSILNDDPNSSVRVWKHNIGNYGSFYGTINPFYITFTVNPHKEIEKVVDDMEIHSSSANTLGVTKHRDTFNTIQLWNQYENTDTIALTISTPENTFDRCKLKKSHFQVAIPPNAVVDATQDIFDPSNLDTTTLFRSRIKSKYVNVKLTYNNTDNNKLSLREIITYYRQVAR